MEWQQIKTAPRDGTFYLAYGSGLMWTQNQPNGCYPGEWRFDYQRDQWRGHAHSDDREATHWAKQPPAPPESKND